MIAMPVWIIRETATDLVCYLGSEPSATAKQERIPKSCLVENGLSIVPDMGKEMGDALLPHLSGCGFAIVTLDSHKIPEDLKKAMYAGKGAS